MTATSASHSTNNRSAGTPSAPADPTDTVPAGTPAITVPATVRARMIAAIIDLIGGVAAGLIIAVLFWAFGGAGWFLAVLSGAAIVLAVRELLLARTGWTLGGKIAGVRLLSARTGRAPGIELFLHADLTFICVVPTLGIGAIVLMRTVARDPRGRGWHDRLTGIEVVSVRPVSEPQPSRPSPTRDPRPGPFSDGRLSFTASGSPITEVGNTVDTTSTTSPAMNAKSAIIDSVPWSAVPTPLDSTTDDAPSAPQAAAVVADTGVYENHQPRAAEPAPERGDTRSRRRRRSTSHRKSDSDATGVRLVPADGGSPILLTTPAVLGRDPQNISDYPDATRVALPDVSRSISKTHAAVAPVPGGLWVTDLHSTNGTRVTQKDGIRQTAQPDVPVPAPVGSVLILGRASYRIEQ
ncbi:RDD family protein [Actinomyces qiguomingii]|uniref:RDD family protein n=1 Tax=Actinomyces qiguomingii TaxID=2057800 RepID=UPI000CA00BEF|nr:RDD family protein [Actinomyces qiguomingii]